MLPKHTDYKKPTKGLYFDFLEVTSLNSTPVHWKSYGGMAAGSGGLYDRITHHQSPGFRAAHRSFHYTIMELEGTQSEFRVFAVYPEGMPFGRFLLAEGHQIAIFGLYESQNFLQFVSVLCMPAIDGQRSVPIVGLNNDVGLTFQGWDVQAAEKARDSKSQKKAHELTTTGFPVSFKLRGRGNIIEFMVLH